MRGEAKAALAVTAAAAGTGLVSGNAAASFFAPLGGKAWIAIPVASAVFGLLCGLLCRWVKKNGGGSLIGAYLIAFGGQKGRILSAAHLFLLLAVSLKMLLEAGHMALLTLPMKHAFWIGASGAVLAAILLNRRGMWRVGGIVLGAALVFFAVMAIDPRDPLPNANYETELCWADSWAAAIIMPMLCVALSTATAMPVAAKCTIYIEGTARFAALCGAFFGLMLLAANAALARGGARLLAQTMPMVLLAARWGKFGFYTAALLRAAGASLTLASAMGMMTCTVLSLK